MVITGAHVRTSLQICPRSLHWWISGEVALLFELGQEFECMSIWCSCVQNTGIRKFYMKSFPLVLKDKRSCFSQALNNCLLIVQLPSRSRMLNWLSVAFSILCFTWGVTPVAVNAFLEWGDSEDTFQVCMDKAAQFLVCKISSHHWN